MTNFCWSMVSLTPYCRSFPAQANQNITNSSKDPAPFWALELQRAHQTLSKSISLLHSASGISAGQSQFLKQHMCSCAMALMPKVRCPCRGREAEEHPKMHEKTPYSGYETRAARSWTPLFCPRGRYRMRKYLFVLNWFYFLPQKCPSELSTCICFLFLMKSSSWVILDNGAKPLKISLFWDDCPIDKLPCN